ERLDHQEALDLLRVAACGGKHQHGLAELAPAGEGGLAAEPRRVPARLQEEAHGHPCRRQSWIRFQNSSVKRSSSCSGKRAATLTRTASLASGPPKKSKATWSRWPRCLLQNSSNRAVSNR